MQITLLDTFVFILYIAGSVLFAMWMGSRKGGQSADTFFKADKQLPWYVVGASIISAGVSSEQFIGTVGIAYLYGMALANWQWGAPVVYTILIFVFLPFYMRGNVTTMPEFLERRFNTACRRIYALVSIVSMVFVLLGVTMFAGAKALNVLFPDSISLQTGIIILALTSAAYSVYGGLLSSVWADFIQYIVLMVGGLIVGIYSIYYAGGITNLLDAMPEKAIMLYDAEHQVIPWFGLLALFFSVGLWYNCANQVIVQRFLGSRSEWDARMGVIMAGFSMAIFPLLIVVPGIAAFYLFHDQIGDGDRAWPYLVKSMLPSGLIGIVLAGLASSVLGSLAAVANSAATIFTYDIYKPLIRKQAPEKELFLTGRLASSLFFLVGVMVAISLVGRTTPIFVMIQTAFSYMAAPIAGVFLVGILWKGATSKAATVAMVIGFISIYPVVVYLFATPLLSPYDSFPHHTFAVFVLTILLVIVLSFFTKRKTAAELKGVLWDRSALTLPENERKLNRGIRDFRLWWALMIFVITTLYVLTYSRANETVWLEGEKLKHSVPGNGAARIQPRDEMKNFTMWTNSAQLLFTPSANGDAVTLMAPSEAAGPNKVAVVVTRGPEYGSFSVSVNGTTATITRQVTEPTDDNPFTVSNKAASIYDANTSSTTAQYGAAPDRHVVDRLELGTFDLTEGLNALTFTSVHPDTAPGVIGIDQVILTPAMEE
jgi:SSS family solute:Na+ symporter